MGEVLGVKLYSDGWLGPRTAALRAPYSDHPQVQYTRDPFPFGILFLNQDRAIRDVARADLIRENLFELPEDCIAAATLLMTITNGEIAFEGEQAYPPGHATCRSGAAPAG